MENPRRSGETLAEYKALPKPQQDDLKDVGGGVGGTFSGSRRKADAVIGRDLLALDLDNIPAGQTNYVVDRTKALNYSCCIHSTRKHSPSTPKLRIYIPTDRTVTPDEYVPIARLVAAQIGMEWVDQTTFEPSRLMYWPSCCADSEYIFEVVDKPLLSADFALNLHTVLYGDWRDPANWCGAEKGTDSIRALAKKQGDPTEKSGIVGAFCRKYDVFRAMDELIRGTYTPVDTADNRYTFVGGSTTGGAIVYDGGKFLYSHHATDPCSGKLVNSFDLVRLHKFGATDDTAAPGTPAGRMPTVSVLRRSTGNDGAVIGKCQFLCPKQGGIVHLFHNLLIGGVNLGSVFLVDIIRNERVQGQAQRCKKKQHCADGKHFLFQFILPSL